MGKRLAFCISLITLAGCGGAQQSANGIPQGPAALTQAAHSRSWMLPEAKNEDLLYVSSYFYNRVNVYSYPNAKAVGTLTGVNGPVGMCTDQGGNVWVTNYSGKTIVEYAHGGTQPIATLRTPKMTPSGCTIDQISGNLAVSGRGPELYVYAGASGSPTIYRVPLTSSVADYDNNGNLFANGNYGVVAELQNGSKKFRAISFPQGRPNGDGVQVHWDGRHLAMGGPGPELYRYDINRFTAVPAGPEVIFNDVHEIGQVWFHGGKILVENSGGDGSYPQFQIDKYPAGGNPFRTFDVGYEGSMTVSLAPK